MSAKTALQLNAVVGVVSTIAATAMISLALTQPAQVAAVVARHDYTALAMTIAGQLAGWAHAILRFL